MKMRTNPSTFPAILTHATLARGAITLFLCGAASAQSAPVNANGAGEQPAAQTEDHPAAHDLPGWSAELTAGFEHLLSADFSDAPGSVSVTHADVDLTMTKPLTETSVLRIGASAERSWYSFDGATGFVTGQSAAWDNVLSGALSVTYSARANERVGCLVGAGIESSGEDGADFGDTLTYGAMLGATYALNENVQLGGALRVQTRLEESALVLPFPTLDWRINERTRLSTEPGIGGVFLRLAYEASDEVTIFAGVGVEGRAFRLDDVGAAPGGVGRVWTVPVRAGAMWKFHPQGTLSAHIGYAAFNEYTLDDSTGNELAKFDTDGTFLAGLSVTLEF